VEVVDLLTPNSYEEFILQNQALHTCMQAYSMANQPSI
jgi:pyridoxal/pyridoxine/pyridoxamine kinase